MTLTSAHAILGLSARATPAGINVFGKAPIGDPSTTNHDYTAANVIYAFKAAAAAASNKATLTLSSGVVAQTTGSPVITDGDGKDFEGATLTAMVKLMSLRLRTPLTNGATAVAVEGSSAALPTISLPPGSDVVIALPAAGVTITGLTLAATFAAQGDILTAEILGKTA